MKYYGILILDIRREGVKLMDYFIGYCVVVIIVSCIFGAITKNINENKGYDGGFAWGFFLGIIGIVVVACRSDATKSSYVSDRVSRLEAVSRGESSVQRSWQCGFCRRMNADYMTTCECGKTKAESMQRRIEEQNQPKTGTVEQKLGEAKSLLEKGIITEEEYEVRRKKILETVN